MSTTLQKLSLTAEQKLSRTAQQTDFMMGDALVFDDDDHIAPIMGHNGCRQIATAVKSKTDAILEVHFIDAWEADGVTPVWYIKDIVGGAPADAGMIDYVRSTNSVATLADVEFIL